MRMVGGHQGLLTAIVGEIRALGPIPFARFMELALYHPEHGYYMRFADKDDAELQRDSRIGEDRLGEDRLGWSGDYYTSSDVHPVMAQALCKQIDQMDELLGRPDPVTVLEMGAGKGRLAYDLLVAAQRTGGDLYRRLRYVIVERSPVMQAAQRQQLSLWLGDRGRVAWFTNLKELGTDTVVGVLFSNELVDAFPVHRIRIKQGRPQEIFVDYEGGRFCERLQPLSTPELKDYLVNLAAMDVTLPEGACADINLHAAAWMKEVAQALHRGFVMTIDYGHVASDLYGPDRRNGTLRCYYHHTVSDDPYRRVGLQDMTAHVDFTTLASVGERAGLHVAGFTNQMSFLVGLGVEQMLESLEPGSAEFQSMLGLLKPDGMGRTFKILIQYKGVDVPRLDGLYFKPFFGSVLGGALELDACQPNQLR